MTVQYANAVVWLDKVGFLTGEQKVSQRRDKSVGGFSPIGRPAGPVQKPPSTELNKLLTPVPNVVTAPTTTIATSPAMKAYSIAVTPASSPAFARSEASDAPAR